MNCSIIDCEEPAARKGWCVKHYGRWYRHGDPTIKKNKMGDYQICQVPNCDRKPYGHGYCSMHYQRWCKSGDPEVFSTSNQPKPVTDFFSEADPEVCWPWQGYVDAQGYGHHNSRNWTRSAHRVVYEFYKGPIPDGLHIDHRCHDPETCRGGPECLHRRCVNPAHLLPVTHQENSARQSPRHCPGCRCFD